jgi:GLPGLI family protein
MKHFNLFAIMAAFFLPNLNSQNITGAGKVQYKQIVIIDTILNITKEVESTLYIDAQNQRSLYVWDKKNNNYKRELKTMENGRKQTFEPNGTSGTDAIGRRIYKKFNDQVVYHRDLMGQWVLIVDTVKLDWKIVNETKFSNNMTLQKATVDFHGRSYTAWFNSSIPISDGPYKFKGLPGLIIEIYDEKKHVRFELLSLQFPCIIDESMEVPNFNETIGFDKFLKKKIDSVNDAPKKFEALLRQRGVSSYGTAVRTNLIERSL